MTAIVAVLNKHAVSVAADSAATISSSNNQKVFNTANKLFTLSKYHPVSVAIYNNSELIGVPWEIVVKEYRKHLGSTSFNTLQEYINDFFDFLVIKDYFSNDDVHKQHLFNLMTTFMGEIIYSVRGNNLAFVGPPLAAGISDMLDKFISNTSTFPVIPAFSTFSEDDIDKYLENQINQIMSDLSVQLQANIDRNKLVTALYQMLTRTGHLNAYSGIVFCGYGESEIFPTLQSFMVQHVINHKLAIITDKNVRISHDNNVLIMPFAQIDVMQTLIDGISPVVKDIYFRGLSDPIRLLLEDIANRVQSSDDALAVKIKDFIKKGLGGYINSYILECDKQRMESYTAPLIKSVAMLEKDDLADFAESLISITSVKRKMNLNEQNTVGGPIDVLVLSKGDGAVWMKRKHYFDPSLNPNFFNTYLKH